MIGSNVHLGANRGADLVKVCFVGNHAGHRRRRRLGRRRTRDEAHQAKPADYDSATSARGHGNSFLTGYDGYLCILAHTNTFVKYHARTSYLWISYLRKLNMCHT